MLPALLRCRQGVYHYFRDYKVTVKSGITCPEALESSFDSPLAVFLNGNGTMLHIINDKGDATTKPAGLGADVAWLCPAPPSPPPAALAAAVVAAAASGLQQAGNGTCKVGDSVPCPAGGMCAGNECCAGGVTCPSADPHFHCCPNPKTIDCTGPPGPPGPPRPPAPPPPPPGPRKPNECQPSKGCNVCPECCKDYVPDGTDCDKCVLESCAPPGPSPGPAPGPQKHCLVNTPVNCPGTTSRCAGSQCCLDGSTCPSAPESFHGCAKPKEYDCTKP